MSETALSCETEVGYVPCWSRCDKGADTYFRYLLFIRKRFIDNALQANYSGKHNGV